MTTGHLDRLSSIDASFLAQERQGAHMHIGAVMVFEGPPPSKQEFEEEIDALAAVAEQRGAVVEDAAAAVADPSQPLRP